MTSLSVLDLSSFSPIVRFIFFVVLDLYSGLLIRYCIVMTFYGNFIRSTTCKRGFCCTFALPLDGKYLYRPLKVLALMLLGGFQPEQAL